MTPLDRIGNWFAQHGWAHLLLLCGVGIFLFPFVWMTALSMKTDDEAVTTSLMPAIPSFHANSPWVRPAVVPLRPRQVSVSEWKQLSSSMVHEARVQMDAIPLPADAETLDTAALRDAAAQSLTAALIDKMPEKKWSAGQHGVLQAFSNLLTPLELVTALDHQIARLELINLQIHSLDGEVYDITSGSDIARTWHVESGPGELLPAGKEASCLRYHFKSGSDAPIVLRFHFDAHIPPEQLHKLVLSIQGDDSWHRIDALLDLGGQHFESDSTTYIAQYRATSISFQPIGFDDTSYRAKNWVSLIATGPKAAVPSPTAATLRIVIRPSSTLAAIWGKIERNYLRAFRAIPFWTYVVNSLLLVALQMAGSLFSASFVAYAFARLQWPGRSLAFGILLATMMLPSQVTMIPSFLIWRSLGWFNTLNPLWVPAWFGSGFFIFLMTQNMKTIPKELEEAARIDGLNSVQTWWYIILPLVKPTLAAIAIMVFMGAWNDFMGPLIMLRDQSRFPLSLGLFGLYLDPLADSTLIMAGNMLMTVPVIVIFLIFQKYFIEGVTVSGMKG